jgi:anti-sigma B factor antagonist
MNVNKFFKLEGNVLSVTIEGEFDRDLALLVQEKLDEYKDKTLNKIVFNLNRLSFLASSGLRVFIYAKEQITPDVEVVITEAKDIIKRVVKMSGINGLLNIIK